MSSSKKEDPETSNDEVIIEHKLCNSDDMQDESMKEFEINLSQYAPNIGENKTVKVLLIKQRNRFYCLASRCTHYSVPLVNGVLYKNRIRCFAHGACFDIRTGDIEDYPGVDCLPKYSLLVDQNRDIYIKAGVNELQTGKRTGRRAQDGRRPSSSASQVSQAHSRPTSVGLKSKTVTFLTF